mgnify:FL=1
MSKLEFTALAQEFTTFTQDTRPGARDGPTTISSATIQQIFFAAVQHPTQGYHELTEDLLEHQPLNSKSSTGSSHDRNSFKHKRSQDAMVYTEFLEAICAIAYVVSPSKHRSVLEQTKDFVAKLKQQFRFL